MLIKWGRRLASKQNFSHVAIRHTTPYFKFFFHIFYLCSNKLKWLVYCRCNYRHINETMKAGSIIFCFTSDFSSPPDYGSITYVVTMKGGRGTILPYYHEGTLLDEKRNIFKYAPWVPIDYEMSYKISQYIKYEHD